MVNTVNMVNTVLHVVNIIHGRSEEQRIHRENREPDHKKKKRTELQKHKEKYSQQATKQREEVKCKLCMTKTPEKRRADSRTSDGSAGSLHARGPAGLRCARLGWGRKTAACQCVAADSRPRQPKRPSATGLLQDSQQCYWTADCVGVAWAKGSAHEHRSIIAARVLGHAFRHLIPKFFS